MLLTLLLWRVRLRSVLIKSTVHAKDFPPLPVQKDSHPPALHSRVSSFQSRSSTPRVPPGFEAHAHPIGSRPASGVTSPERKGTPVDSKFQRVASATVLPAVPDIPLAPRAGTPKPSSGKAKEVKTLTENDEPATLAEAKHGDISLGSPKARASKIALSKKEAPNNSAESASASNKSSPVKALVKDSRSAAENKKPTEIVIPPAAKSLDKEKLATPAQTQPPESASAATPSAIESPRASTPGTTTSDRERVPGPRPKTLRLTTAASAKPAQTATEQVPPSATTEKSTPASSAAVPVPTKDAHHFPHLPPSRQHSISSAPRQDKDSRPSTPMSEHSHPASQSHSRMLSEVASRSSTPPPSGTIVGSAPERAKTKNQLKKERREKAKAKGQAEAQTPKDESAAPSPAKTTVGTGEVGPIISRQKKQKKEKPSKKTETPAAPKAMEINEQENDRPASKEVKEDAVDRPAAETPIATKPVPEEDIPATPEPEAEPEAEAVKAPYTLGNLYSDLAQPGAPSMQTLLAEKTSSFGNIISDLVASGDVSKDHSFFQAPSFTTKDYKLPGDSRKGQAYLDAHGYTNTSAFGYVYVPRSQRRELLDGAPIVIGEEPDKNGKEDLLKSCLISPSGAVMRHLTTKDIDRVLELEERRVGYREEFGDDVGGMQNLSLHLEPDDNINLEGGVEEIVRHGEGKGVVWVYESGDEDGDGETDEEILEAGEYDDDEEVWEGDEDYDDEDEDYDEQGTNLARERKVNLRGMSVEELQKRLAETQHEFEASRKEVDRLEKGFGKRGKEMSKWRDSLFK